MPKRELLGLGALAVLLVAILPICNAAPPDTAFHVSNFTLNLFGKFLTYAILALGLDLLWGYAGVLSLGHGVFFGLGAYAMGMHLMLEIGTKSVYQSALPDFMVWNRVTELPLFWQPFHHGWFTLIAVVVVPALVALVFGFFAFRSRIRGVYFSIITQAFALCAWLIFNRNELNLGGTNGLADFKTIFGFPLGSPDTQRGLYVVTALALVCAYGLCRWIVRSRAGKVLVAIRDSETRVLFTGYSPVHYKLFVFVVSAALAGVAGALYVPQVGIITPARIGVLPSIEMVVWVAAGGRGTLIGAVVGAFGINWIQSWLTTSYPDLWLLFLGALFMSVVLFIPDGVVGATNRLFAWLSVVWRRTGMTTHAAAPPSQSIGLNDLDVVAPVSGHPRSEPAPRPPSQSIGLNDLGVVAPVSGHPRSEPAPRPPSQSIGLNDLDVVAPVSGHPRAEPAPRPPSQSIGLNDRDVVAPVSGHPRAEPAPRPPIQSIGLNDRDVVALVSGHPRAEPAPRPPIQSIGLNDRDVVAPVSGHPRAEPAPRPPIQSIGLNDRDVVAPVSGHPRAEPAPRPPLQ